MGFGRVDQPVFAQSAANVAWAAVTNQYFGTIIIPANAKGSALWAQKFPISAIGGIPVSASAKNPLLAVEGALGMPGFSLTPGQTVTQHFDIFAGPREYERLKALGGDEDELMDFGTFKIVSKVLLNSMNWLHARFGSYAAAIIVLTLIIRSLMWPLQNKSTESMKKMQLLTPKMNELKAKYEQDPQRMNQEVMKLYKDHGVNPLSGCLPMVIQIPIFWGLFRMLGKAVELRNSHFLWIHDLSQPDTVGMFLGYPINILPLFMALTNFFQMKLSPKSGDATQQKMFMFMPLIFVIFCYNYASALPLYWTVQNIFTIGQLYITRNKTTPVGLQKISGGSKKKARG
jgi:YidC/Oxa1 family membrane protein insertase